MKRIQEGVKKPKVRRKYSDDKYDNAERDARIGMQTLKALEGLGLVGLSNVKDDVKDLK
jgi:hypothetical protein